MDILSQLEETIPLLSEMHLGHTPFQIEFFKTAQQKGSRKFEYWNHLVQMKSLEHSIRSLWLDIEEIEISMNCLWRRLFGGARGKLKNKRLDFQLTGLKISLAEKELEISRHLKIVLRDFGDLLGASEKDIMDADEEYWVHRLSRQLAYHKIAVTLGLPVGEVASISVLPEHLAIQVLEEAKKLMSSGVLKIGV